MNRSTKFLAITIILFTLSSAFSNLSAKPKSSVVTIQTSAVCESCKARIERALKSTDGIISANLNLDDKKVKVKYNPDKITADKIKTAIANTGYDADDVKKTPEAFNNLPHCCQKGGAACEHQKESK